MLTDTQKAQCRLYLGYPDYFRYKHTRLEGSLDKLSPEAEVQVGNALTQLVLIEDALMKAGVFQGGVKRVDEIWFENGWRRASEIRKTGRMYAGRISIITGVPVYSDVFGTQGYLGDSFSGMGNAQNGGGRFYGLG